DEDGGGLAGADVIGGHDEVLDWGSEVGAGDVGDEAEGGALGPRGGEGLVELGGGDSGGGEGEDRGCDGVLHGCGCGGGGGGRGGGGWV
ncbi:hypothetical protein V495_08522, partial [Pseudogymnoascus sp. VKM F-4514 (FW-929)]